jgi:hypothetical protein
MIALPLRPGHPVESEDDIPESDSTPMWQLSYDSSVPIAPSDFTLGQTQRPECPQYWSPARASLTMSRDTGTTAGDVLGSQREFVG